MFFSHVFSTFLLHFWLILCVRTCNTHQWHNTQLYKENKEVNIIDPNPNNSYKTKENFMGFYTKVIPHFFKVILGMPGCQVHEKQKKNAMSS